MANLADLAQTPTPRMLGTGLAQMAGSKIAMRKAYNKYAIEASQAGEEVVPFDEWIKKQDNS